ncbi:WD40 repeat domain-containing protein [Nocardiopsis metallicus]|uniref:WD40 repeat protein n=1 Tax=Nocardiopsis metallicus TaxID=179819 RepID=A0A840WCZ6_9ACTN|nr:WD40 repeat domain-containing protein [Nocardiopsis metallicus]MBB5489617.1 WD40 repeat protein [Nocardiopsis metallicus]
MSETRPPRDYSTHIRDCANLVDRLYARGPERVGVELAEHVPGSADPSTGPGALRRLLLTRARLLTHSRNRDEVACTLHRILAFESRAAAWLTGVEESLPPVRLSGRGPDVAPVDGRLLRVLTGQKAPAVSVDWSPDGTYLAAVGSYDATVMIWDSRTGEEHRRLRIPGAALDAVLWSPDGRRLAVLGKSDRFRDVGEHSADDIHGWENRVETVRTLLVYDTETWEEHAATPTAPQFWYGDRPVITWSPDGRVLAVGEDIGVRLWSVDGGEELPWLIPGAAVRQILGLHWHGTAGLIALAKGRDPVPGGNPSVPDSVLVTWSDPTHDPGFHSWARGVPWYLTSGVRWHPEGELACVTSRNGTSVCDPGSGKVLWRSEHGLGEPRTRAVEWSPDGGVLAELQSQEQGWSRIVLWDVGGDGTLTPRGRIECAPEETTALSWSPGGEVIATAGSAGVRLWVPRPGEDDSPGSLLPRLTSPVWSPDGAHVALWSGRRWYVADARDPRNAEAAGDECPFPHDGTEETRELIEAARHEGQDYDPYTSMYGHHAPDAVSPGRGLYALAGGLAPIRIFDLLRGGSRQLSGSKPEGRWVLVRFNPGGDRLVTVQQRTVTFERDGDWVQESVLTLWDVVTGEQRACSRSTADLRRGERTDDPNDLAVGRDHVVWCGRDGVVALHDAHTLEPLSRVRVSGALGQVVFSPDEGAVAVTGNAGVRVFDVVGGVARR